MQPLTHPLTQPFAQALAEAEQIIVGAPHVKSERDLAEGHDYLAGSIQASLRLAWAYQRDFPYFVQSTGPYSKMGLDNPSTSSPAPGARPPTSASRSSRATTPRSRCRTA
jgi:hypothetical protein